MQSLGTDGKPRHTLYCNLPLLLYPSLLYRDCFLVAAEGSGNQPINKGISPKHCPKIGVSASPKIMVFPTRLFFCVKTTTFLLKIAKKAPICSHRYAPKRTRHVQRQKSFVLWQFRAETSLRTKLIHGSV